MAYIDKEHSLSLALREVCYRYKTHLTEKLAHKTEVIEACQRLYDVLWEDVDFWEAIGIAESRDWACDENDNITMDVSQLKTDVAFLSNMYGQLLEKFRERQTDGL